MVNNVEESHAGGQALKQRYEELGLSQQDLSRLTGLSEPTISNLMNGQHQYDVSTLHTLAGALQTTMTYLVVLRDKLIESDDPYTRKAAQLLRRHDRKSRTPQNSR